jgi:hypothetical protein
MDRILSIQLERVAARSLVDIHRRSGSGPRAYHEDMTMTQTATKYRTITLTDRPPAKIREDLWPTIAEAHGDSYDGSDYARHQQAVRQGEVDDYLLRVRQHADGRTLVYGVLDAAISAWHAPAGGEYIRGGELLDSGADVSAAIRRVGEYCHLPDSVIRDCVASLPAVEI